MAFTGITATEAEIDQKTGANVSASFTDVMKTESLLQAESWLNAETMYNWSDAFVKPLNVDVLNLITSITASLVAIDAINYDMSGYTSRAEAQSMLDVLRDIIIRGVSVLKDVKNRDFVINA